MRQDHRQFQEPFFADFEPWSQTDACVGEIFEEHFMNKDADSVGDEEVLQMILQRAAPGAEPIALSRELMNRFQGLDCILSAPQARLQRVKGVTSAIIRDFKLIEIAAQRMSRSRVMNRVVLSNWQALLEYCRVRMAGLDIEECRVLFLDRRNRLVADEALGRGTVGHVPVYPREVAKRALEHNASAVILVHNHPSGDPTPSTEDITMTGRVRSALETLDITLHDHLIVARENHVSFRSEGLI